MAVIRLAALEALARRIACAIPELDHICVGQQGDGQELEWPHLSIIPGRRWRYLPDQAEEVHDPGPGRAVYNVGRHEVTVQLQLGAKTLGERYALEERVLGLFLGEDTSGDELIRPGILLTQVASCPGLGTWLAAWELDDARWEDALAFSRQHYAIATITGVIPALVTRRGVYTIEHLRLGLTEEFEGAFTPADLAASSAELEVVEIQSAGSPLPL